MQCIYLQIKPIDFVKKLSNPNPKEDDIIDLDEKLYECLTGPGTYETTEMDRKKYCSFSNGVSQDSDNFTYCPRYRAIKEMKEIEAKVNH